MRKLSTLLAVLATALAGLAQATVLTVQATSARSPEAREQLILDAARSYNRNLAALTRRERELRNPSGAPQPALSFPVSVRLEGVAPRPTQRGTISFNLQFETSGPRAFDPAYRALLLDVFNQAQSAISLVFGAPSESGTVWVRNYDADLGDREVVGGGIYVHNNGNGEREIRFPVYADGTGVKPEVAAINFIHTLLLAYQGSSNIVWDGWNEGLVRAATMQIARTPGALPGLLNSEIVENVLEASYEVGPTYDWNNQRALSGPVFIAPNLRTQPLPVGGSVGGLYLLRFQMAGSAWQKVLAQYPSFVSSLMSQVYANPSLRNDLAALRAAGQNILAVLSPGNATVEGQNFASWTAEQQILNPTLTPGPKLQVQPFAFVDGLGGSDFGVFGIQAHAFDTLPNGNEILSQRTSFPIYWSTDFTRFFASAQDDRIDIFQGYGAVAPNFPSTPFAGQPYRVTVDVPVGDQLERVSLPAGAIATATNPTPNNFFGTVTGVLPASNQTLSLEVSGLFATVTIPVTNFAFGTRITDANFDRPQPLTVRVRRTVGANTTTIFTRRVNKGVGPIGLVLNVDARTNFTLNWASGVQNLGLPLEPQETTLADALGQAPADVLTARWNPNTSQFDFGPSAGALRQGHSVFFRADSAGSAVVVGRQPVNQPISIALRQGWNMVANPLSRSINRLDMRFVVETGFPLTFNEAVGSVIGSDLFRFVPNDADPVTGVPETGAYGSVTGFGAGDPFWVKVLSPTGATLVIGGASGSGARAASSPRWNLNLRIQGGGDRAEAAVGQAQGATNGLDRAFDTEGPPGAGGVSMLVSSRYRDTRAWGGRSTWQLQLSGLKRGALYTVRLEPDSSRMTRYRLSDPTRLAFRSFNGSGQYTFIATGATRRLVLETEAPR